MLVGLGGQVGCPRSSPGIGIPKDSEESVAAIFNNNGVMLLEHERGDVAGALLLFQKAVSAHPKYVIGYTNLGIAYFAQTMPDYPAALEALNKAEQLGGRSPNLYFTRGLTKTRLQDFAGAEQDFRRVLSFDSHDAFTHYHLGTSLRDQEKYAEAIQELRIATRNLPTFQSAWFALGQVYRRTGNATEAAKAEERVKALESSKTGITATSTPYFAGLGKYIEPLTDTSAPKRQATGPMVTFVLGKAQRNLMSTVYPGQASAEFCAAAWGDYNGDGLPDLVLAQENIIHFFLNNRGQLLPEADSGLTYPGRARGASWADYDNDGNEDVLIYGDAGTRVYQNIQGSKFRDATASLRLSTSDPAAHAVWVDFNHDGFLDILVVRLSRPCALYRNNGGLSFTEVSVRSGVHVARGVYALPTDFDRDRAVDFIIVAEDGSHTLLRNNYDGTFRRVPNASGLVALGPSRQFASADLNSDGLIDIVAATNQGVRVAFHQPDNAFRVQSILPDVLKQPISSVNIADLDNDGNYDVVALAGQHLLIYRGNGDGTFANVTTAAGVDKQSVPTAGRVVIADLEGTGFPDLLIPAPIPVLLQNSGNKNRWVRMNLRGLKVSPNKDWREGPRSNGSGIGALVEAWTESSWLTTEVTAASGNDSQPIMGLGVGSNPRWARILWSSGVHECEPLGEQPKDAEGSLTFQETIGAGQEGQSQNQIQISIRERGKWVQVGRFPKGASVTEIPAKLNKTWVFWEPNRAPTSCPVLYVWDGQRYRFITDLQGGAIVGYNIGLYQYNVNDPDEYVLIPGDLFALKGGQYRIEIANQLQEVLFIDAVHLLAVDHPSNTHVFSNDRMLAGPPYPKFAVWSVDKTQPLRAAKDDTGANVLPLVSAIDRRYPENFQHLPYPGFTKRHTLTLDLGDTSGAKRVYLLFYGWQDYAHSSSNLAAAHVGIFGESPSLQMKDHRGQWRTVIKDMGSVAGLPKWLAVDLTPYLPPSSATANSPKRSRPKGRAIGRSTQVRIVTNLALYWDKIEVGLSYRNSPVRITRMKPLSASYRWIGYPTPTYPDGRNPVVYNFEKRRQAAPWASPAGNYTRPGDVTELLQKPDDMYVIMRHGHAIHIAFDPAKLPPLPKGWKRDFIFYSDGFGKDMDMNGAYPLTVEPLPFHKMTRYPYGPDEHYPDTQEYIAYRAKYNTAYEPGHAAIVRWPELHAREIGRGSTAPLWSR
jgi:tetratricopeptide (TPR) repeat protein